MCLDFSDRLKNSIKKEHGEYVGWKIYRIPQSFYKNKKLKPQYNGKDQKVGEWLYERRHIYDKITHIRFGNQKGMYHLGFHIYLYKENAESYSRSGDECVRKVYFRKMLETGWQNNRRVIVARYLKILRVRTPKEKRRSR